MKIRKTGTCLFGHGFDRYTKTCDMDRGIKVFNQANCGLTISLNRGIKLSHGQFIARIDEGDIANPDRLKKQIEFMEVDETLGIIGTWYELIDDNGNLLKKIRHSSDESYIKKSLLTSAPLIHSSLMIRREALYRVGFYNEQFKYAQDRQIIFSIMKYYGVGIYPEYLVKLRLDTGSTSFKKEAEQKKYCAKAIHNAVNNGLYPWWCHLFAFRYYLSSICPPLLKRYKDILGRYIGIRHG